MADVQQVEAAVGKHDGAPRSAIPRDGFQKFPLA
jgi:hypothetical protein